MRRSAKHFFRPANLLLLTKVFFKILLQVKNWPDFIANYSGLKNSKAKYYFRNGLVANTTAGVDAATLAVVWIKKEYGNVSNLSTVIDIGGNIGAFSLLVAKESPKCNIYAFEPEPNNFAIFKKNILENKFDKRIKIFQQAVSGETKKEKLFISEYSPYHSLLSKNYKKFIFINSVSLDNIFQKNKIKNCDLLKIDCEGSEFNILYSTSKKTLNRINNIRLEYHNQQKNKANIGELKKYLLASGFKLIMFHPNSESVGGAWFKKVS